MEASYISKDSSFSEDHMDISQHSFQWGSGTISELSTGLVSHVDCACELITLASREHISSGIH